MSCVPCVLPQTPQFEWRNLILLKNFLNVANFHCHDRHPKLQILPSPPPPAPPRPSPRRPSPRRSHRLLSDHLVLKQWKKSSFGLGAFFFEPGPLLSRRLFWMEVLLAPKLRHPNRFECPSSASQSVDKTNVYIMHFQI